MFTRIQKYHADPNCDQVFLRDNEGFVACEDSEIIHLKLNGSHTLHGVMLYKGALNCLKTKFPSLSLNPISALTLAVNLSKFIKKLWFWKKTVF